MIGIDLGLGGGFAPSPYAIGGKAAQFVYDPVRSRFRVDGRAATAAAAITPSDGTDLAAATRAINVSDPGYVKVTTVGGDTVTLYVAGGVTFPLRAARIWATGTTATEIVGLW